MQIDNYSYGRLRIKERVYEEDLVVFPDKVSTNWSRKEEERIAPVDIRDVLDYQPELLVVGQGDSPVMELTPDTKRVLFQLGIPWVAAANDDAVAMFNDYEQERKKVVGLFHLGP